MEDIDFVHTPEGVKVYTTTEPYMEVIAQTYEMGKSIIERNIVWLAERRVAKAQKELEAALAEVQIINITNEVVITEDTAPSEWSNPEHYMDGNNQGC
jgi:hypothetical protein